MVALKPEQFRYHSHFIEYFHISTTCMLLYRIFLLLYPLAARVAGIFNVKARKWCQAQENALADLEQWQPQKPVIWMHCASLGEFEQGLPVLEAIRRNYPDYEILLSFFSPSGFEPCQHHPIAEKVVYLPLDGPHTAKAWVKKVQPAMVLFIKYEFWYYYLHALRSSNIPVLLVSAVFREEQPFFQWYGGFYRKMLACYNHILVQDAASARQLQTVNTSIPVTIAGDSRFDRVLQIAAQPHSYPEIEEFIRDTNVFIAGSTWPEDDKALQHFVNHTPGIRNIIVPHLIDADSIEKCLQLYTNSITFSDYLKRAPEEKQNLPHHRTLIIDKMGMLSRLYRYATIVYVGGGFGADGIHNVLEAAVYGKPIVIGPIYDKFLEAVELVAQNGLVSVASAIELEEKLQLLLKDAGIRATLGAKAQQFTRSGGGAAERVIQIIQENRLLTR